MRKGIALAVILLSFVAGPFAAMRPVAGTGSPVLMERYSITRQGNVGYDESKYQPRAFGEGLLIPDDTVGDKTVADDGDYDGYDILKLFNYGSGRADANADWLTVTVKRAARLVVVNRGGAAWPTGTNCPGGVGWTAGSSVTIGTSVYPTLYKDVAAGDTVLCGPASGLTGAHDTPIILLAESGGTPSTDPDPSIAPNQPCPSSLHDAWGGNWHPSIDETYWCYYGHEHGVDPSVCDASYSPRYGEAAAAAGMSEGNAGFKTTAWVDPTTGTCWAVTIHQGTAGTARLCTRYHTVGLAVWEYPGGTKLADVQFMGDFGRAVDNQTKADIVPIGGACAAVSGTTGKRQISTVATGGIGYEPWSVACESTVFAFSGCFNVNTFDVVTKCDVVDPCDLVATGDSGSKRQFQGAAFGFTGNGPGGSFCTDPMGMQVQDCALSDSVHQYVEPFLAVWVGWDKVIDYKGWGQPGIPTNNDLLYWNPTNREHSIGPSN